MMNISIESGTAKKKKTGKQKKISAKTVQKKRGEKQKKTAKKKIKKKFEPPMILKPGKIIDAKLYSLPIFEFKTQSENTINFDDFLLGVPESLNNIIIGAYPKDRFSCIVENRKFRITIFNDTGFFILPCVLEIAGQRLSLSIYIHITPKYNEYKFIYFPDQNSDTVQTVSVAGDFNNWNQDKNMLRKTEDGSFSLSMNLNSGTYRYKSVINNKIWESDRLNSEKLPDGMGGYNSVLKTGSLKKANLNLYSRSVIHAADGLNFFFAADIENKQPDDTAFVYFIINNILLEKKKISNNEVFSIFIPENYLIRASETQLSGEIYKLEILLVKDGDYLKKNYNLNLNTNDFDWRNSILYFLFTDRFYKFKNNTDYKINDREVAVRANYNGGNFRGISEKIKSGYFTKLGVNSIWISPVVQNPETAYYDALPPYRKFSGYHGYWPIDPYKIERRFGGMTELKELVKIAHKHNIKIMLDFVANHTHQDYSLYKEHLEYYGVLALPDGRKNIRLFDEYTLTTWFDDFLPSFDYSKDEPVKIMADNAMWLIRETDIDGFRLDAVKHIHHKFWKALKKRIKNEIEIPQGKVFYLLGESICDRENIMEYVNQSELSGQFDFPLYFDITEILAKSKGTFKQLNSSYLLSLKVYGNNRLMCNLIGNHDFSRFMAYAENEFPADCTDEKEFGWHNKIKVDNPRNYRKLRVAFGFIFTIPGIPMIYYGDEFGMTGAADPDNRRMMRFDSRLSNFEKSNLEFVSKLANIRNKNNVFKDGDFIPLVVEDEIYAYLLSNFEQYGLVVITRNYKEHIKIKFPEWTKIDLLNDEFSGKKLNVENDELGLNTSAFSVYIYTAKKKM